MRKILLYSLALLAAAGCSKNTDTPDPVQAGGTWTLQSVSSKASYSEISFLTGYQIRFGDSLETGSIQFTFRKRPEATAAFTPATDTAKSANVVIQLRAGGVSYHVAAFSGSGVDAEIVGGKLRLKGTTILMKPDSAAVPDARLDFDLREY